MFVDVFEDSMAAAVESMGVETSPDGWQTGFEAAFSEAARTLPRTTA